MSECAKPEQGRLGGAEGLGAGQEPSGEAREPRSLGGEARALSSHHPCARYVIPVGQNPTGTRLARARYGPIYDLCRAHDVAILEVVTHDIALQYSTVQYSVLHCIAFCIAFCIALHCIASHRIASHRIALHCIASHCIALYCIASHCIASHRIALHRIASHRIALHCTAFEHDFAILEVRARPSSLLVTDTSPFQFIFFDLSELSALNYPTFFLEQERPKKEVVRSLQRNLANFNRLPLCH